MIRAVERNHTAWEWVPVGIMMAAWMALVGRMAIARHLAFHTSYDLAIFSHATWTTAHARPFFISLMEGTTSLLGHHFSPLLAVLAPLYWVWPDARTLLAVQVAALAVAALPLFSFARARIGVRLAWAVVAAYFLSPALAYVALADFHEIALAVPVLMAAGAALLDMRYRDCLLWLILAMLAKEEVALVAVGFGLYALVFQRRIRFGAGLALGATLWGIALIIWIIPAFNQGRSYNFLGRYDAAAQAPMQALLGLAGHPLTLLRTVATRAKATFIWQLLAPLAGLPLLGVPAVLLAVPTLAYLSASGYEPQTSIRFHYTAPLLPFLYLAAVVGLQRLGARGARLASIGAVILLLASAVCAWRWSPLPGGMAYQPDEYAVTAEDRAVRALLSGVPADAAIAADWEYLPWLANRWWLAHRLTPPFQALARAETPDLLVSKPLVDGAISAPLFPWVVFDPQQGPLRVPRYTPAGASPGGVVLWKWLGCDGDVVLTRYDAPFDQGLVLVGAGTPPEAAAWGSPIRAKRGTTLPVWLAWAATGPLDRRITFSLHLVDAAGELRSQVDREMADGHFPTTLWHTWMTRPVVADQFPLVLQPDLPAGTYRLLAGAYESEGVKALSRPDGSQWFDLATIEVEP
jgi:uncharacterized membrane protein